MKKNNKYLLDTNIILRYLLKDNIEQYQKLEIVFDKIRTDEKKAIIPEGVLAECVYVLEKFYKVPKKELSTQLAGILYYKGIINPDKEALIYALNYFQTKNLDIVDCILISIAKFNHFEILSLDKKLLNEINRPKN